MFGEGQLLTADETAEKENSMEEPDTAENIDEVDTSSEDTANDIDLADDDGDEDE